MLAAVAFIQASLQPDFALPIQPAPILLVHAPFENQDAVFGVDTGSMDLLLKPTPRLKGPTTDVELPFLSNKPIPAKIAYFPSPASGIIGLNSFRQKAIGIDVHNATFSLYNSGNLSPDQVAFYFSHKANSDQHTWDNADAVTYQTMDLMPAPDGHYLIDGKVGDKTVKLGLDTDSAFSTLDGDTTPSTFAALEKQSVGGLQNSWPISIGVIDNISLGTETLPSFIVAQAPPGSLKPAQGLLGFDMLQNRRTLIDFPAKKLYLGSLDPSPMGEDTLYAFGIRLLPPLGPNQFIAVIPGSPASKAGLQSGDELLQIDGKGVGQSNVPTTGSVLPFDYVRTPLPSTITVSTLRGSGQATTTTTITRP